MQRVSGQLRFLDKSSNRQSQFFGLGKGMKRKTPVPDTKLQNTLDTHHKNASTRGKQEGDKGEKTRLGHDLLKRSTYSNPRDFQSVGFMRTTNSNIEPNANIVVKDMHKSKKKVLKPARQGKKDESGKHLPAKKEHQPPTKVSNIKKRHTKKTISRKKVPITKSGQPVSDFKETVRIGGD